MFLRAEQATGFQGLQTSDFDLCNYIKAVSASEAICIQFVTDTDNGTLSYFCRCSVA